MLTQKKSIKLYHIRFRGPPASVCSAAAASIFGSFCDRNEVVPLHTYFHGLSFNVLRVRSESKQIEGRILSKAKTQPPRHLNSYNQTTCLRVLPDYLYKEGPAFSGPGEQHIASCAPQSQVNCFNVGRTLL